MCPGLTSPGAKMTNKPKGTVVVISIDKINKQIQVQLLILNSLGQAIMAEGKQHAVAVGITVMSTDDM